MMNRYLYDGTVDGLLSSIAWILEEEPDPGKGNSLKAGRYLV